MEAFDADGKSLSVVLQTAEAFEIPLMMKELVEERHLPKETG